MDGVYPPTESVADRRGRRRKGWGTVWSKGSPEDLTDSSSALAGPQLGGVYQEPILVSYLGVNVTPPQFHLVTYFPFSCVCLCTPRVPALGEGRKIDSEYFQMPVAWGLRGE